MRRSDAAVRAIVDWRVVGIASSRPVDDFLKLEHLFTDPDWMRRGARALVENIARRGVRLTKAASTWGSVTVKTYVWIGAALSLLFVAGCTNDMGTSNGANISNTAPTNETTPSVAPTHEASASISPTPSPSPTSSASIKVEWENVETHDHPFEGTLNSFDIKDGYLISINFSQKAALLVPTDPIDNPDEISYGDFENPKSLLVRNDDTESSKLTEKQIKLLKKGQTYMIYIYPWLVHDAASTYDGKTVTGTMLPSIYYKKNGKFYSLKDNSLFDGCGVEGCRRVEK